MGRVRTFFTLGRHVSSRRMRSRATSAGAVTVPVRPANGSDSMAAGRTSPDEWRAQDHSVAHGIVPGVLTDVPVEPIRLLLTITRCWPAVGGAEIHTRELLRA